MWHHPTQKKIGTTPSHPYPSEKSHHPPSLQQLNSSLKPQNSPPPIPRTSLLFSLSWHTYIFINFLVKLNIWIRTYIYMYVYIDPLDLQWICNVWLYVCELGVAVYRGKGAIPPFWFWDFFTIYEVFLKHIYTGAHKLHVLSKHDLHSLASTRERLIFFDCLMML